jgi:uncharacterized membrane protein
MRYQTTIEIARPINEVSALFQDLSNMHKWQEGLQSYKHLSGKPGQPGAKMELKYVMGKRKIDMIETIVANELPARFDATYDAKGVHNMNMNRFEAAGPNTTRWTLDTEFEMRGFMKLLVLLFPGMFKKQTAKMMNDFKRFAESN